MKIIELGRNKQTIIDDEDYGRLLAFNWHAYSCRGVWRAFRIQKRGDKWVKVEISREILKYFGKNIVDHINNNPLDNRKKNLRICTPTQNRYNVQLSKRNKTGYKGIKKSWSNWEARIIFNGKYHYLGSFETKIEAARAYNLAAKKFFGKFANLNQV